MVFRDWSSPPAYAFSEGLDAEAACTGGAALTQIDGEWRILLNEARSLRDGGYRRLAQLPR